MDERILIAEDEEVVRRNIHEFLGAQGYRVDSVGDGAAALENSLENDYALVIADIRMPEIDGITLLQHIVAARPATFVLIMTAYASVETAIKALRLGAYDYLLKPIVFEDLLRRIQNLFAYRLLKDEVLRLRRDISDRLGFEGIIGQSPEIRKVFDLVGRVAPSHATVLVTGESGTGKELVARAIHSRSRRADKEFLAINMAALPAEIAEAELFGHEKGAFTGAERQRDGLLRSVSGGTVFLDEISELPLRTQAKLLRAVESREILPLGGQRALHADFRLIAATNRDLAKAVTEQRFREDLYFRINVIRIEIPALRNRRDDIPSLVSHFLKRHGRAQARKNLSLSNETMRVLLSYAWPGNVRELSNVVERACILCDNEVITVEDLPTELMVKSEMPTSLRTAVKGFERKHIAWVLRAAGGNREQAAKMLGIDPATLYRRLATYEDLDA